MQSSRHTKVAIVFGTRPEFVKLFSIIKSLQSHKIDFFVVHTGQHYSANMDEIFFSELNLPAPEYRLSFGGVSNGKQIGQVVDACVTIFKKENPSIVLVEGDTNSVLAGAMAANKLKIPVGHIEAGLRSNNMLMAEERNRIVTDHLSAFHFAPTEDAVTNLKHEGFSADSIFLTGNTIADAVEFITKENHSNVLDSLGIKSGNYFLVTMHRPECVDFPKHLRSVVQAIGSLAKSYEAPVLWPIHPRTKKNLELFSIPVSEKIQMIEPLGYLDFSKLVANAKIILTDSGGVQEEACILGIPAVTLREDTERPETVQVGANIIGGFDEAEILSSVEKHLAGVRKWKHPYGSNVGDQIVSIILNANL